MAAANTYWVESNGAGEVKTPDVPTVFDSLDNIDFLSVDESSHGDPDNKTDHPILVPAVGINRSFEKWTRLYFDFQGGIQIDNGKFWKSSGTLSHAGLSIKWPSGSVAISNYDTPSDAQNVEDDIPISEPLSQNILFNDDNSQLTASGFSDYIILQLWVASNVDIPGNIGNIIYTFQYDEV
jgi:hypothetical protein